MIGYDECTFYWSYKFPAARWSNPLNRIDLSKVRIHKWIQDMLNSGDLKYAQLQNVWITPPPHIPDQLGYPPETFKPSSNGSCVSNEVKRDIYDPGSLSGRPCSNCSSFLGYPPAVWPPHDWSDPRYGLSKVRPGYKTTFKCLLIGKGPQAVMWEKWIVLIRNIRVGSNRKPQEYYTQGIFLIPSKIFYDIEILEAEAAGSVSVPCKYDIPIGPGINPPAFPEIS